MESKLSPHGLWRRLKWAVFDLQILLKLVVRILIGKSKAQFEGKL
jgi:hypothetical protein